MDIFGRNVTAIRYDGTQMVNAYVDRKPGDCIKEKDEAYQCLNNCQGKIVVARFDNRHVVSLKALTPFTFQVADWLEDKISNVVPYFEILNDPALRTHLRNPMLYQLVARLIGPEGISELQELRNTDSKKN